MDELQLKQMIKSTVEEVNKEKQSEQAQVVAQAVVEFLKQNNSITDEEHRVQHEWIKQQIEKEQKLQERYSDFKWKSFGSMFFFGFVAFVSAAGWALVQYIKELIKNGGN